MESYHGEVVDLAAHMQGKLQKGSGIYRAHIARAIREVKKPDNVKDLRVQITELGPSTLGLGIFENQVQAYSDEQRGAVMDYIKLVQAAIELNGLEVKFVAQKGSPPPFRE